MATDEPPSAQHEESTIRSKRDLTALCEIHDLETNAVLRTTFTIVDDTGTAWFGQVNGVRKYDLSVEDCRRNLKRIPEEKIYHSVTPNITALQVGDFVCKDHFNKRPQLLCLDDDDEAELLPKMLLEEAKVLEVFQVMTSPEATTDALSRVIASQGLF